MRAASRILRGPWCVVWLCLLAGVRTAAAAGQVVVADFDGDNRRDRAELEHNRSVLRVWLSTTERTSIIRSPSVLVAITATDLDGDRRAELIGSGSSAALHIWTKRPRGFVPVRPRHRPPAAGPGRVPQAFNDGPRASWLAEVRTGASPLCVVLPSPYRAPPLAARLGPPRIAGRSGRFAFPFFGPRPPPAIDRL